MDLEWYKQPQNMCPSFQYIKSLRKYTSFEYKVKYNLCTVILLSNLAEAEWVSVPCNKPLTPFVTCVRNFSKSHEANFSRQTSKDNKAFGCKWKGIKYFDTCYYFLWKSMLGQVLKRKSCLQCLPLCNKERALEVISHIYTAISVKHNLPPLVTCSKKQKLTTYNFFRHLNIIQYKSLNKFSKGYVIYHSSLLKFSLDYITFRCDTGEYISIDHLCDGKIDCLLDNTDENQCTCDIYNSRVCKILMDKLHKQCLPLYHTTMTMTCTKYKQVISLSATTLSAPIKSNFSLLVGLNDYYNISCMSLSMLPCLRTNSNCYYITDVCKYFLSESNDVLPCRNGGHLEKCDDFQCDMMYKCINSYCIPWSYRCDLKWDCPLGNDETGCLQYDCTYLYRCRNTLKVCIHIVNLCDGNTDCPYADDEQWCEFQNETCSQHCFCLLYAIDCQQIFDIGFFLPQRKSYLSVSLSLSSFQTLTPIKHMLRDVVFAKLSKNKISTCKSFYFTSCTLLDLSYNLLMKINKHCFSSASQLRSLSLNGNQIKTIDPYAFSNQSKLKFLNISKNPFFLTEYIITKSIPLVLLVMGNISNTIEYLSTFSDLRISVVLSDQHDICCMVSTYTICTPFQDISCSDLVPTIKFKLLFIIVCFLVFTLNISSLLANMKMSKTSKGYLITSSAIHFSNCIFGIYLLLIWISDLFSLGIFYLYDDSQKFESLCLVAFGSILWFTLMSPLLIVFLSVSRMMLTIHPVDTIFKRESFIDKALQSIAVFSFTSSLVFLVILKIFKIELNYSLCLPFITPSLLVLTFIVAIMQVSISFITIIIHIVIIRTVVQSKREVGILGMNKQLVSFFGLTGHLAALTISNILSWCPVAGIYIVISLQLVDNYYLILWSTVLGSSINPIIYPTISIVTLLRGLQSDHS